MKRKILFGLAVLAVMAVIVTLSGCKLSPKVLNFTAPSKTTYYSGQELDISGADASVKFSDGSSSRITVTKDMFSGYDSNKLGTQIVTFTYSHEDTDLTSSFTVTVVSAVVSFEIKEDAMLTADLSAGEDFGRLNLSGKVDAVLYNNEKESIDLSEIPHDFDPNTGIFKFEYKGMQFESSEGQVSGYVNITTDDELADVLNETDGESETIIYLEEKEYSIPNIYILNPKLIVGNGASITLNQPISSQAYAVVKANMVMRDLSLQAINNDFVTLKLATLTNPLQTIEQMRLTNVKIYGGKGALNVAGVSDITIDRCTLNTSAGLPLAASVDSNIKLVNSEIGEGSWGSIGIMYSASNPDYMRPVTITIDEATGATISGYVYIEGGNVAGNQIIGYDNVYM